MTIPVTLLLIAPLIWLALGILAYATDRHDHLDPPYR